MAYALCLLLFMIGLYAVATKRNLIKIVIGFIIMENSINLLLIMLGYRMNGRAPIMWAGATAETYAAATVDPLPQALVLTSIVISLGVTALMVAICLKVYQRYGTFDISKIRRLKG